MQIYPSNIKIFQTPACPVKQRNCVLFSILSRSFYYGTEKTSKILHIVSIYIIPIGATLGAILCCVALFMKVAFSFYRFRNHAAQSFRRGFSFHFTCIFDELCYNKHDFDKVETIL